MVLLSSNRHSSPYDVGSGAHAGTQVFQRAYRYCLMATESSLVFSRCSTLERLYPRKTLESTWRPPETLWSLYSGLQIHSGICLAAAKSTLESIWRTPD
ncbi:hypothetical protein PoB_003723000 [Plakobranchus ocellatus]|uniref:Uncharacterized protein n=1 Tax=Plakobranchus ocellatus TaxID=259542 RepID=A0AAV4AUZ9_9GAST|nr:hypothetical protein PoB_003723000 [Plakobranchus ocellatus]